MKRLCADSKFFNLRCCVFQPVQVHNCARVCLARPVISSMYVLLRLQLFEERPVWSRRGIEARVKFRAAGLRAYAS